MSGQFWHTSPVLLLPPPPAHHDSSVSASHLPDEVARIILEQLCSARDVASARAVCRKWRRIVDTSPVIWRELVFDAIPRAHSAAAQYYRRAAAYGNSHAAFLLAILYSYGYRPTITEHEPVKYL